MRTSTFFDWLAEVILLAVFCGAVTLAHYLAPSFDVIHSMWIMAGVWAVVGLLRYLYGQVNKPPHSG